jgi:tetratricopeptide (TPR) repeat protein
MALVLPPPEATVDQLRQEISRLNVVGQSDVALRIYSKAKSATLEKQGASRLFLLGMSLFDGGHYKESLQAFEKCAASERNTDPVYKLLGCV